MRISQENSVEVVAPEGVSIALEGSVLKVKGPKGETSKVFFVPGIAVFVSGQKFTIKADKLSKKEKKMMGTYVAHVKNMIKSVTGGVVYKLKVCSGHFPMTVQVKGNKFVVNNFLGEKFPRVLTLKHGDVKVSVEGDIIEVLGFDKDRVSQTAASIEMLMKRTEYDRRIFQDGIYITQKDGKPIK
jgi:large subunit ribosomal protein L6